MYIGSCKHTLAFDKCWRKHIELFIAEIIYHPDRSFFAAHVFFDKR